MKREKLIRYRGKRSQAEIAKKAGVSQQTWNTWESGQAAPRIATIPTVAKRLGITPTYFFKLFY